MTVRLEDVLSICRQLEQARDALPETAPEQADVMLAMRELRELYRQLTENYQDAGSLTGVAEALERAQGVLKDASLRLGR